MFIPSSVIHGFTVGVAFIIGLNQLNSVLGLSGLQLYKEFLNNLMESLKNIPNSSPWSVLWFIVNFSALMLLLKKFPKIP